MPDIAAPRPGRRAPRWRRRLAGPPGAWALATPLLGQELAQVLASAAMTLLAARVGATAVAAIGWVEALGQLLHAFISALALGAGVAAAMAVGRSRANTALPRLSPAGQAEAERRALAPLAADALALAAASSLALALLLWWGRDLLLKLLLPGADAALHALARGYLGALIGAEVPASVVWVAAGVLRGWGRTRQAMQLLLWMTASQLLLALGLMHGLGWGVAGAEWALLLSRGVALVACLWVLAPLWRPAHRGQPGRAWAGLLRHWRHRGWRALASRHARTVLGIGGPAALENLAFHVGKLLTQSIVASLGAAAMAANYVAFALVGLVNVPGNALGAAAATLVGQQCGAGRPRRAAVLMRGVHHSGALWLCLLALPMAAAAPTLVATYSAEPEVQRLATQLVWLNCLFMPVWAASFVLPAALRGAADTRYALHVAAAGMWLARVVLGAALGLWAGWGVLGVWLGMFADWCLRGALFWRRSRRPSDWPTRTSARHATPLHEAKPPETGAGR